MNVNYSKTISISLIKLVLPLLVLLFIQVAANAQNYTPEEQNCYSLVQGKVAWNTTGTTSWSEANVRNLCKGTTNANATVNCFRAKISGGMTWDNATPACSPSALSSTSSNLDGSWAMYNEKGVKYDKLAKIVQSGANLSFNNGYGGNSTAVLNSNTFTTSDGLIGTVSADGTRINWNTGYVWVRTGSTSNNQPNYVESETILNPEPLQNATVNKVVPNTNNTAQTPDHPGWVTRTITIKNNGGFKILAALQDYRDYYLAKDEVTTAAEGGVSKVILGGQTDTFGGSLTFRADSEVELQITQDNHLKPYFIATLPKNKDITTFCYEVSGTIYIPVIKTCDGSPTYEAKYISFKNESAFAADMRLTYYSDGSKTKTFSTEQTVLGYSRKLYLPMDADTDRKMTLSVYMVAGSISNSLLSKDVKISDFDTVGSSCYKTWGSGLNAKASACSISSSARRIKLWNNGGYSAKMQVTYNPEQMVETNFIEVTQTETIEIPESSSNNPVKISLVNKWSGKEISNFTTPANFTGELCYKVEGTTFAPTAATCDDTVGDTAGETRQIRFQNESGYDAQMMVTYFEDQVINGTTVAMPKILATGMINGLGGKFRLVTIPKNTSKGQPITISLQGSATLKNGIWSTTLPADFAASPQPCFKVWGTLFEPQGGKCGQ